MQTAASLMGMPAASLIDFIYICFPQIYHLAAHHRRWESHLSKLEVPVEGPSDSL